MSSVLLVPPEGDPAGLLAQGCGDSYPPMAGRYSGRASWTLVSEYYQRYTWDEFALVLARDEEPIPEGIFRAWYVAETENADVLAEMLAAPLEVLAEIARGLRCDGQPLGEIVVLP